MIDQIVQQLIEQAIDSPTKLHLLLIFHEHPRLEITPNKMAERTCRDIWSVAQAMHELVEDGILSVAPSIGEPRYRYTPRPEKVEPIRRLVAMYDDPLGRDVLHRAIRDLAGYASRRRSVFSSWERQAITAW